MVLVLAQTPISSREDDFHRLIVRGGNANEPVVIVSVANKALCVKGKLTIEGSFSC
jgi:hypothetical protein